MPVPELGEFTGMIFLIVSRLRIRPGCCRPRDRRGLACGHVCQPLGWGDAPWPHARIN